MATSTNDQYRSLMVVSPKLYRYITDGLEQQFRIHSYDLQLFGKKEDDGVEVIVRHGEQFDREQKHFFQTEEVEEGHSAVEEFVQKTGEAARQVLIDDYFKIMAP